MDKIQRALLAVTSYTSWNKSMIRALKEYFEEEKRYQAYGASENLLQTGLRLKYKKWNYVIKLWNQRPTEPSRKQAIKNDYIRFIINNQVKFTDESLKMSAYELFSLDKSAKQLAKNVGKMSSSIQELHNLAVTMLVDKKAGTASPDATGWLEFTMALTAPPSVQRRMNVSNFASSPTRLGYSIPGRGMLVKKKHGYNEEFYFSPEKEGNTGGPATAANLGAYYANRAARRRTLDRSMTNPPGYIPPEFQVPPTVVPTAPPAVNLPPTVVPTAPPLVNLPPAVTPAPVYLPSKPSISAQGKKAPPPPSKPKKVYGGKATRKQRKHRKGTRRA